MKKGHRYAPDITGQKFGKLTAIRIDKVKRNGHTTSTYWLCQCECGNFTSVEASRLKTGYTKSCGCLKKRPKKYNSDNKYHEKLYRIWIGMKTRCYNSNAKNYKYYGGKGISVCNEWRENFQAFYDWSVTNGYRPDLTIDRIKGDKNYSPDNCRWATSKEQAKNTKQTILLEYNGESKTFSEWSEVTGIPKKTIQQRTQRRGWSAEKALTTPVRNQSNKAP